MEALMMKRTRLLFGIGIAAAVTVAAWGARYSFTPTPGKSTAVVVEAHASLPKSIRENMVPMQYSLKQLAEIRLAAKTRGISHPYIPSLVDDRGEGISGINAHGKHTPLVQFSFFDLYESNTVDGLAENLEVSKSSLTKTKIILPNGHEAWWGDFIQNTPYRPLYTILGDTRIVIWPGMNKPLDPQVIMGMASTLRAVN